MVSFFSLVLSIIGLLLIIKSLIKRFDHYYKNTRCSLQTSGKIVNIRQENLFLYHIYVQYYALGQFIERVIPVTYFQFKYYQTNRFVTIDYDSEQVDFFLIEEDAYIEKYTNIMILIGLILNILALMLILGGMYEKNNNSFFKLCTYWLLFFS